MKRKALWFPDWKQMLFVPRNDTTYLRSLWLGTVANLLNIPASFTVLILIPLIVGVIRFIAQVLLTFFGGIFGRLQAYDYSLKEIIDEVPAQEISGK